MKRILDFVASMWLASIFLFIFAAASAVATFVENDYGTAGAKALVYNAGWFEGVMVFLALSLLINIVRQKLYTKEKLASGLMHSSFIIILIGAAITRYAGYEGIMHIREGESTNKILSADTYITVVTESKGAKNVLEEKMLISKDKEQKFEKTVNFEGKNVEVTLKEVIPNAVKQIEEQKSGGKPMISLVIATDGETPSQKMLEPKSKLIEHGITFELAEDSALNSETPAVRFFAANSKMYFIANKDIEYMSMADKDSGIYKKNEINEFIKGKLYNIDGISFVPRLITTSGVVKLVSAKQKMKGQSLDDALVFELKSGGETKSVTVMGQPQSAGESAKAIFKELNVSVSYGSKELEIPVTLKLKDFILSRYPGSMSPSSYESVVSVTEGGKSFDERIYMNHTLDAAGFRFFQSSYDPDEKGTILSVSKDPGKLPTYFGYLLMGFSMLWLLINKNSRFRKLNKLLDAQKVSAAVALLALMFTSDLRAEDNGSLAMQSQSVISSAKAVNKEVADAFSTLLVQDFQGRIKPVNTLAVEIMDKVTGSETFDGMSANEVMLGMLLEPKSWQQIKFIKVTHPEIKKLLGMGADDKKAAFVDFFDENMGQAAYKLGMYVEDANRKKPSERGTLDKDILKIDERLNILYMVYSGQLLKIFPKPSDPNNAWIDPAQAVMTLDQNLSHGIKSNLGAFFSDASESASNPSKVASAMQKIEWIKSLQAKYGSAVMPPEQKLKTEILYNKLNIFKNLIYLYLLAGFILLITEFASLTKESKWANVTRNISLVALTFGFVLHTANLAARWYISGHAPWSDGYESMTYIAWATTLAGLLFVKKSSFTLALTAILSGIVLFVAHLSWMDPQITNIVPVLKSYWLTIHVSMITASYGFLGLGALIGFVCLILFTVRSNINPLIDKKIRELAVINEMTLIVGLFMLTVGNFLGGVWANESWGRYWGWDPKETWALVSILIYTIVVHSRYIPKLNSPYVLSVLSMFAFCSIVMTYFGVNFYLSGLHSYAQGDPVPVPTFVYVCLAVMVTISITAFAKRDLKLLKPSN